MPCPIRKLTRALALCALASVAAAAGAGDIHVWKDNAGGTHYSDMPPVGVESERIGTLPPTTATPGTSPAPQAKPLAEQELEFRRRRTERVENEAKLAAESARKEKLERQCIDAERQLAALESGQRVSRFNSSGEREFLDDQQRQAEAVHIKQLLKQHCGK